MPNRFDTKWVAERLATTLADLQWIAAQIPEGWGSADPSGVLLGFGADSWNAQTILAHLCAYESRIAVPVLEDLLSGGDGRSAFTGSQKDFVQEFPEETKRLSGNSLADLLSSLKNLRQRQAELVAGFDETSFNRPVKQIWPTQSREESQSAGWAAAKTVQHTWEHGNTLFQIALLAPH